MSSAIVTANTPSAGGIGLFEKWLSVWVALCMATGLVLGNIVPGLFELLSNWEYASVNFVVAVLIWAMVYPMMVAVDFSSLTHILDRPKGLVITVRGQLADQALHHGGTRRAVLQLPVRRPDPAGRRAVLHRRPDPPGRGALHRHGVRLVADDPRRRELHPGPGLGERPDHDLRLRAHRRPAAGRHRHRRALGDPAAVGGALRRHSARRWLPHPALAGGTCRTRRQRRRRGRPLHRQVSSRGRSSACSRPWCCCSASRVRSSSTSPS